MPPIRTFFRSIFRTLFGIAVLGRWAANDEPSTVCEGTLGRASGDVISRAPVAPISVGPYGFRRSVHSNLAAQSVRWAALQRDEVACQICGVRRSMRPPRRSLWGPCPVSRGGARCSACGLDVEAHRSCVGDPRAIAFAPRLVGRWGVAQVSRPVGVGAMPFRLAAGLDIRRNRPSSGSVRSLVQYRRPWHRWRPRFQACDQCRARRCG